MNDIIENIRKESDIFSKAKLINHLLKNGDMRVKDLAEKLAITSSYLCHLNRLNRLPVIIVDGYYSKLIKLSHLFIISRINDEDKLIRIYEEILSNNLTIKQTEDLIRELLYEVKNHGNFIDKKEREKLVNKIENKYSDTSFQISQTRTKTRLIIEIKGNLEKTTKAAKKIVSVLTLEEDY